MPTKPPKRQRTLKSMKWSQNSPASLWNWTAPAPHRRPFPPISHNGMRTKKQKDIWKGKSTTQWQRKEWLKSSNMTLALKNIMIIKMYFLFFSFLFIFSFFPPFFFDLIKLNLYGPLFLFIYLCANFITNAYYYRKFFTVTMEPNALLIIWNIVFFFFNQILMHSWLLSVFNILLLILNTLIYFNYFLNKHVVFHSLSYFSLQYKFLFFFFFLFLLYLQFSFLSSSVYPSHLLVFTSHHITYHTSLHHHFTTHHIISYHIISYHIISYHIISHTHTAAEVLVSGVRTGRVLDIDSAEGIIKRYFLLLSLSFFFCPLLLRSLAMNPCIFSSSLYTTTFPSSFITRLASHRRRVCTASTTPTAHTWRSLASSRSTRLPLSSTSLHGTVLRNVAMLNSTLCYCLIALEVSTQMDGSKWSSSHEILPHISLLAKITPMWLLSRLEITQQW